jgi:hypothetical protein
VVDVDRLQPTLPDILEAVRNAGGPEDGFSRAGLDDLVTDEEPCPAFDDDKGLVVGMDMQPRTFPRCVVP